MTTRYTYYVELLQGNTKEKPAGVYRAPKDNPLYLEALREDGKWHFSPRLVMAFTSGDTLDIEDVSEGAARKAIKNLVARGTIKNPGDSI